MLCSFFPYTKFAMALYQVCKTVITSAAIISTAIFTTSCSHTLGSGKVGVTGNTASSAAAAEAAGIAPTSTSNDPKSNQKDAALNGVITNHDIYHAKTLEVPAGKLVPALAIRVDPDVERGWNLYTGTANFTFAPESVGGESSHSEGHAQLYINEKPMQRIYSTWTHLPELPPGKNTIRVTLNANGYETLTTQNVPIQESTTVEVYDSKAAKPTASN
jgi:hypothetical protein